MLEDAAAAFAASEQFEQLVMVGITESEDSNDGEDDAGDDGDGEPSGEVVSDDISEDENSESDHESAQSSDEAEELTERAKAAWRNRISLPPPHEALESVVAKTRSKQTAMLASGPINGGAPASEARVGGTIYRLLLSELHAEATAAAASAGARWIDADALLQLRGAAALAHSPNLLKHTQQLPRVSRGVRIAAKDATHGMQEALARALAHATGSKLVAIDDRAIEEVKRAAAGEAAPLSAPFAAPDKSSEAAAGGGSQQSPSSAKKGSSDAPSSTSTSEFDARGVELSTRGALAALIDVMREDGAPYVVFLRDKGTSVFRSGGACSVLAEELRNRRSRALFLLSTASDPGVHSGPTGKGSAAGGLSPQEAAARQLMQQQQQQGGQPGGPNGPFLFPPGMFPPGMMGGINPNGNNNNGNNMPQGMPFMPMTPGSNNAFWASGPDPNNPKQRAFYMVSRSPLPNNGQQNPNPNGQQPQQMGNDAPPLQGMQPFMAPPPQFLKKLLDEAMAMMKDRENAAEDNDSDDEDDNNGNSSGINNNGNSENGVPPSVSVPAILDMVRDMLKDESVRKMLDEMIQEGNGGQFNIVVGTPMQTNGQPMVGGNPGQMLQNSEHFGNNNNNNVGSSNGAKPKPAWLAGMRKSIMNKDEGSHNNSGSGNNSSGGGKATDSGNGDASGRGASAAAIEAPPTPQELKAVLSMFEDLVVPPPGDATLRRHWDKWVADDVGRHNARQNRQLLGAALRANDLRCADLRRLDPLLAKHLLSAEEAGAVVLAALKAEASRLEGFGGVSSSSSSRATGTSTNQHHSSHKLPISLSSMELAFATVCREFVARPGQPLTRTREEVAALAQQDRHEQALVTNVILPRDIGVTYDQIGGLREAKELLRQCITYPLKFPHLYSEGIAQEAVKGVLLFGPPGTGKTMLAKAVATEGGATFLSIDASVIENKWLGESEKNARAVFTLARRLAPCVIYLDEVDSVLSSREKYDDTTHGTLTSVKTTIMQEWDGLRTTGDRVVVIASTNRPFDLDEAVLRRLPRRIMVDLPDAETREEILRVTMANNRVASNVNFTQIAADLEGFTGSDIKEVCREAVVRIAHERAHQLETGRTGVPNPKDDLSGNRSGNSDSAADTSLPPAASSTSETAKVTAGVTAVTAAETDGLELGLAARLRLVTMEDFSEARKRLTTSVSEKGKELAKVWEWNEEYGEIKKKSALSKHHLSMYL